MIDEAIARAAQNARNYAETYKGGSSSKPAAPDVPEALSRPGFGPGMYPGLDNASSELRIYGTVGGGVPRGYRNASEATDFVHCVNMQLPQGLPAQTPAQRAASLAAPTSKCMIQVLRARENQVASKVPGGLKLSSSAIASILGKKTSPTLKLNPSLFAVPPRTGDVPGVLPDPTDQIAAGTEDTIMGLPKNYALGGAALLLVAGGAYLYSRKAS